jgi:hypothetical protein
MDIWNLTEHQLDVIRTFAIVAGNAGTVIGAVIVPILIRFVWQARKAARQAAHQTRREEWADGTLHTVDVSELASNAIAVSKEVKQETRALHGEITDMWNDPGIPKDHGRRRLPTGDIRTINRPGESHYE